MNGLEERAVTVLVSTELLADLEQWSQPVQVQIIETPGHGTGYSMTFRTVDRACRHETSIHGRCADCGMTWQDQAHARGDHSACNRNCEHVL